MRSVIYHSPIRACWVWWLEGRQPKPVVEIGDYIEICRIDGNVNAYRQWGPRGWLVQVKHALVPIDGPVWLTLGHGDNFGDLVMVNLFNSATARLRLRGDIVTVNEKFQGSDGQFVPFVGEPTP